jgi:hypothetical protein
MSRVTNQKVHWKGVEKVDMADSGCALQYDSLATGEWAIGLARSGFGYGPEVGIDSS